MIPKHSVAVDANQLRTNLEMGMDEIVKDIVVLTQRAGYDYMEESFGPEFSTFSGFSLNLGPNDYRVGFNSDHFGRGAAFHRFTVSHELGHLSISAHRQLLDGEILHRSQSERFRSTNPIEREADYFAVCFLAPAQAFRKASHPFDYNREAVFTLSELFGISPYSAVLRFIELTDLACTLVVSNADSTIDYEWPSGKMKDEFGYRSLRDEPVPLSTLTADFINGNTGEDTCTIKLNDWFGDLDVDVEATESVIELGYNGKFLTLLTPHAGDLESYRAEADY